MYFLWLVGPYKRRMNKIYKEYEKRRIKRLEKKKNSLKEQIYRFKETNNLKIFKINTKEIHILVYHSQTSEK